MASDIIPRTQDEIVSRTRAAMTRDPFGFESDKYIECLDFDHAREFLKADIDEAETRVSWGCPSTMNDVDAEAKGYLTLWLEKIENERGISVCRATAHYTAWKWLLGHKDADTFPGSIHGGSGGWYQRLAYDYIKQQIDSGVWDRLTTEASASVEGR